MESKVRQAEIIVAMVDALERYGEPYDIRDNYLAKHNITPQMLEEYRQIVGNKPNIEIPKFRE